MSKTIVPPLQRQLRRVGRRLFWQRLLDALTWAWVIGLMMTAGWFLVQPFAVSAAIYWLRWAVGGWLVGMGSMVALVVACRRRPNPASVALALDERCALNERVTTSILLTERESASAVGMALLADVNQRLEDMSVAEKFPVRFRRSAGLVPACALGLTLLTLFYHPRFDPTVSAEEKLAENPEIAADIQEKLRQLHKKGEGHKPEDKTKSSDLDRLEAELDRLARQPHETKEQGREAVKEMSNLEERMQKREKELADKASGLKAQMAQMSRLSKKKAKDGPAQALEKALKEGDFARAKAEAEKLGRQLAKAEEFSRLRKKKMDETLSPEERDRINEELEKLGIEPLSSKEKEQLEGQMEDLEKKLERLSRDREQLEQELRDMEMNGDLTKEELDRELDQLEDFGLLDPAMRAQCMKMAKKLAMARKALREDRDLEAGQLLEELAEELEDLDCEGGACRLAKQLAQLKAARQTLCRVLDGQPVPGAGRRPESPDKPTKHKNERVRSPFDQGKLQVIDHVPGGGFKGPRNPVEMIEEVRRAAQEAPEAIDRQRLPRSASDMAKGYFEKLRGGDKEPRR